MPAIDSTAGAFLVGLVTSVHCVGMCGPLACTWALSSASSSTLTRDTALYHAARLSSYTVVGAIAGAIGIMPLQWFHHGGGMVFPWALVVVFLAVAFGLDRWMPKPRFLGNYVARFRLAALRVPSPARAAMLGLCTPLLPCGPLYLMFALAMAHGSALSGAQFAFAFGLGTLPLLWIAQSQMKLLSLRFGPHASRRVLRGLAFCAALVIAWRLRGTLAEGNAVVTCH